MDLTYYLLDFENVQPPDLGLLVDPDCRVKVFHGPHQNKLDMDVVKALQPFGDRVEYIQSDRQSKNALDFHLAFYIGRLLEKHQANGKTANFVVVSRDRDFEPLLAHVRSLGYAARQVVTIGQALNAEQSKNKSAPVPALDSPAPAAVPAPHVQGPHDAQASPTASSAPKQAAAKPAPKQAPPAQPPAADGADRVIEHLRKHSKNRPKKRVTLERHVPSILGGKASTAAVQQVIAELVRRKVVAFTGDKVQYALNGNK